MLEVQAPGKVPGFTAGETPAATKQKSPAGKPTGPRNLKTKLPFAVLESLASTGLTVFLALPHSRITSEQSFRLQYWTQVRIDGEQCPRKPVTHRAGLAIRAAASDGDLGIVFFRQTGRGERLGRHEALRFDRKIVFEGTAIDDDFTCPARQPHPGHRGLAASRANML
jgi:hypothetical protein